MLWDPSDHICKNRNVRREVRCFTADSPVKIWVQVLGMCPFSY